jgi:hypothetical protein
MLFSNARPVGDLEKVVLRERRGQRRAVNHLGAVERQASGVLGVAAFHGHHDAETADGGVDDGPEGLQGAAVLRHPPVEQVVRRDRALARQERRQLVVLQDDRALRIDDKADIEEQVRPVFVPGLGLGHDEHAPLAGEAADAIRFGAGDVDGAAVRELRMVEIENLVVESLQRTFRDGDQAHRNVEIRKPVGGVRETFDMLEVLVHVLPPTNAPESGDQSHGSVRLDHLRPQTPPTFSSCTCAGV